MRVLKWAIILGIVVAVGVVIWRLVSRRRSLPCPYWLIPLLENPYMNAVAGSALLLDRAQVSQGMKVLDVGCGPGRITLPPRNAWDRPVKSSGWTFKKKCSNDCKVGSTNKN